jgi:uncharacterized repeat protein (TIGR01451 family)
MSSERRSGSLARRLAAIAALASVALVVLVSAAPAPAGTPPNRLDDNRGNPATLLAVNTLVTVPPFTPFFVPIPPLLPPPVGPLTPRVLGNPSIHNVYWDPDWDDHHSGDFSTGSIDAMTQKLVDSNYFDFAGQYDVGHASFDGSDTSGGLINPCPSNPGSTTNFLEILFFIECETSLAPTGVPSPFPPGPFSGDDLYVVYLPVGTTIDNFGINQSCDSFGAYHFMGVTLTLLGGAQFPFAVIPLDCANGDPDQLSELVSHEAIEAATDPNVVMGWIDNSKFDLTNLTPLFTEGEAADICSSVGDVPTDPVRLDNGIMVATYWSNADNACVPFPEADLEISKSDSPDPAIAGDQLYYTLTVTNHGPNDVPDVSVTDHLPSQVEFVTDDRGVCTEGPTGTLTCNFGKVLNGATSTVVIKVHVKANAVSSAGHPIGITNSAEVGSVKVDDPNPTNNTASASTILEDRADLRVTKLCKPDVPMLAGDVATCTILVDNLGTSDARSVVLTDTHVSNGSFTILSASASPGGACPFLSGVVTCNLGTEPAGGRTTITVRETATEAQDINDCASVSSATPDPNHANDESCDGVNIIAAADLSLEKLDSPDPLVAGTDITYTLNAHNAGPSTAKNVVIRDLLPNSVTVVSVSGGIGGVCVPGVPGDPAHPTRCSYATVAPLATKTMVIVVRVNAGDNRVITNEATITSDVFDPDISNNIASATTAIRIADLGIVKASDADTYKPSSQITYKITVVNNGPGNADNVVVMDTLPLSPNDDVALLDPSCTLAATTATCTLGTMAPLASRTLTIAIVLKGKEGFVTNTATVTSSTFDPFASNNSSTKIVLSGNPPKP